MNFEKFKIPSEKLDVYEKQVMNAESLLQILDVIYSMFKDLCAYIDKSANSKAKDKL